MGLAFIQTHANSPQLQFMATVESFPSACRSELTAIIASLLVSPPNSFVTVYTDSLSTIRHYEQTVDSLLSTFPRNILKESNNLLWSILRSIIRINNIHVTFVKVQAHSSNIFNDRVDLLAKLAIQNQEHVLTFLPTNMNNILYFPRWKGLLLKDHLRHFIVKISRNRGFENWLNIRRNQNIIH